MALIVEGAQMISTGAVLNSGYMSPEPKLELNRIYRRGAAKVKNVGGSQSGTNSPQTEQGHAPRSGGSKSGPWVPGRQ